MMAIKSKKTWGGISLCGDEKGNFGNVTRDEINPNKSDNKYLLQSWEVIGKKL